MIVVSLNGPDNVGKTTQLRLLADGLGRRCRNLGSISKYDRRWQELAAGDFARWWFEDSSLHALPQLILESYLQRRTQQVGAEVFLEDRGWPMLEAVCAATWMVRTGGSVAEAFSWIRHLIEGGPAQQNNFHILLVPSASREESLNIVLAREAKRQQSLSDTYRRYQEYLYLVLCAQRDEHYYNRVIICNRLPIVDIQNQIRATVAEAIGEAIEPLFYRVKRLWAIGGNSESGKSTAAEYCRRTHGTTRLKIDYLIRQAASRRDLDDVYDDAPDELGELLVLELDRFARAHYFLEKFTIESIHRSSLCFQLRALIGSRLAILYIEAPRDLRLSRSGLSPEELDSRDRVKEERGAFKIKELADCIFINDGPIHHLYTSMDRIIYADHLPRFRPRITKIQSLGLPADVASDLEKILGVLVPSGIDLFAVTGSAAFGRWNPGLSDIDLFVIGSSSTLPAIRKSLRNLSTLGSQVKVGWTIFSLQEVHQLEIPPKVVHLLRLFYNDALTAQFSSDTIDLPSPPAEYDEKIRRSDLPHAAHALRRLLLQEAPSPYAAYKLVILMAKIILHLNGHAVETSRETQEEFTHLFSRTPIERLPVTISKEQEDNILDTCTAFISWYEKYLS